MSQFLYLTSEAIVTNLKDLYEESLKIEDRLSHLINGVLDKDLVLLATSIKAILRRYSLNNDFTFGSLMYSEYRFVCETGGLEIRAYPLDYAYPESDYVTHIIPWEDLADPDNYLLKLEEKHKQEAEQDKRTNLKQELASKLAKLEQLKQEADKLNSEIQDLNSI